MRRFVPMRKRCRQPVNQPRPHTPGLNRRMIRAHAAKLFRDVFPERSLTEQQWRLVEQDLARKLESNGL